VYFENNLLNLHGYFFVHAMKYISRKLEERVVSSLVHNPVTAVLGPRQSGKSTLARHLVANWKEALYLDLERPSDLRKLEDAELFFTSQKGKLVCLDEIQRKPDLFPVIRSLTDEWEGNGHFLILGSASRELVEQSSESLAGRISYKYLSPFTWDEIKFACSWEKFMVQGGFPRSILAANTSASFDWREDFISTFLERDLRQWIGFSSTTMRRLWQMLAHLNGQVTNLSMIGSSLGVSHTTIRNYIDLLADTFMLSVLQPRMANTGKRQVKSPKTYLTDTGIANTLLGLRSYEQLIGHPSFGICWETLVLSELKAHFPEADYTFYRTSHGSEIDFLTEMAGQLIAVECKATASPALHRGTYSAIEDLKPAITYVVSPVANGWPMRKGIKVVSLAELITNLQSLS
jgi:predicted AAA+ superfamily ATPase